MARQESRENGRDKGLAERTGTLVISGLSRRHVEDGVAVDVCIFRLDDELEWSLDVYTDEGVCIAWDETFETESAALAEFFRVLTEDGAPVFRAHWQN